MKKVLLLHEDLMFYRVPIYNKLSVFLEQRGYQLIVWPTKLSAEGEPVEFESLDLPLTARNYRRVLKDFKIDAVINFLNRKTVSIAFYIYSILYLRLTRRKIIYYGHGLNLRRRDNLLELFLSNVILLLFDEIILYSPNEKRYLWKRNRRKVSIAFNTLDMAGRRDMIALSKDELKSKYGIGQDVIVLFSGVILKRKRLSDLVEVFLQHFKNRTSVGLVIVGPGMPPKIEEEINGVSNIHYMGPVYERRKIAEVFALADIFSIPGSMGLGVVEAFYWGLPIITLSVLHGPEAYYLKHGVNCFVLDAVEDIPARIDELVHDAEKRCEMSENTRKTYNKEATIDRMLQGFYESLERI